MAHLKKGERRTTEQMQQDALEAFEDTGNVTLGCKKARVPRRTFYNWLRDIPEYQASYEESAKIAAGVLEAEAHRRAVVGVKKGVFYKGKKVAVQQEYSDTLLIVLLKAHAPEKYKERTSNEHSGPNGGPIPTEVTHRVIFSDNGG
jgi:hypothetical protein